MLLFIIYFTEKFVTTEGTSKALHYTHFVFYFVIVRYVKPW